MDPYYNENAGKYNPNDVRLASAEPGRGIPSRLGNLEAGSKMPEVAMELSALDKMLQQIRQQTQELTVKLGNVVTPEVAMEQSNQLARTEAKEPLTPMAIGIRDMFYTARTISNDIQNLMRRIEV